MARVLVISGILVATFGLNRPATASYFLDYEGDAFPEQDGWTLGPNGDDPSVYTRSIRDGVFTIDATPQGGATVSYERRVSLSSDDMYYDWRAGTSNGDGVSYVDLIIEGPVVYSRMLVSWTAEFAWVLLDADTLAPGWDYTQYHLVPGTLHTFGIAARGALHNVYIDGAPVGSAWLQSPDATEARIQFGFTKNMSSTETESSWDYVRIGSAPEPSSLLLVALGAGWLAARTRLLA